MVWLVGWFLGFVFCSLSILLFGVVWYLGFIWMLVLWLGMSEDREMRIEIDSFELGVCF